MAHGGPAWHDPVAMMTSPAATAVTAALRAFRADLYACFTQRRDALFDLADALLTVEAVPSPVHLSLAPAHRRGWGSLYAALARGRVDVAALRALLARHPLADGQPVYAVDGSAVNGFGTAWLLGRPRSLEVAYTIAW